MHLMIVTDDNIPNIARFVGNVSTDDVLSVELTLYRRRDAFLDAGNTHYILEVDTFKKMWDTRWEREAEHRRATEEEATRV